LFLPTLFGEETFKNLHTNFTRIGEGRRRSVCSFEIAENEKDVLVSLVRILL